MWTEIGKTLPVREIFRVLSRRRRIFLSVFLLLALATAIVVIARPTYYEASAMILVKRARSELVLAPSAVKDKEVSLRAPQLQEINSEAALLRSRSLIAQVVARLSAQGGAVKGRAPEPTTAFERLTRQVSMAAKRVTATINDLFKDKSLSETDRAILTLEQGLTITPIPVSSLIRVSYRALDPGTAQRVVNMLVTLYRDRHIELHQMEGATAFFQSQVKELEREVHRFEEALKAFDRANQITSIEKDKAQALEKLHQFEMMLKKAAVEAAETRQELTRINAQLAATPEHIKTLTEMRYNPVLPQMKQKLVELEMERARLLQNFMPRDQRVRDIEKQIEAVKTQVVNEAPVVSDRESVEVHLLHRNLLRDRGQAEVKLAGLDAKRRVLEDEISRMTKRARDLEEKELDRVRLERQVKTSRDSHALYLKKLEESRISSAMDESGIMNMAVAEPATKPLTPVDNRGVLIVIAGLVLGMGGGIGAAFVREIFDNSFTTRETVEQNLSLPVIVSIPEAQEQAAPRAGRMRKVHWHVRRDGR